MLKFILLTLFSMSTYASSETLINPHTQILKFSDQGCHRGGHYLRLEVDGMPTTECMDKRYINKEAIGRGFARAKAENKLFQIEVFEITANSFILKLYLVEKDQDKLNKCQSSLTFYKTALNVAMTNSDNSREISDLMSTIPSLATESATATPE